MPQWCVRRLSGPRLAQARLQVDEAERHVGQEPAQAVQGVGVGFSGYLGITGLRALRPTLRSGLGCARVFFVNKGKFRMKAGKLLYWG